MPKTPTGARRPADVIGNAVHVMRIAMGQIEEPEQVDSARARAGRQRRQGARVVTVEQKAVRIGAKGSESALV